MEITCLQTEKKLDYKTEMTEKKESFFDFYSKRMKELEKILNMPEEISKLLEEKRNFGYEKYGEFSFQSNFQNAIASPTEEHLREELIDAINYTLHSMYKACLYFKDNEKHISFMKKLIDLYNETFDVFEVPE
jgi:hypothetical protein